MQVTIDGVVTPLAIGGLSVDNAIGQRSTASLRLLDLAGANHYQDGQRVDVTDGGGALVYSGVIDGDDEAMPDSAPSTSGLLTHSVACKDWHYLADKRLAATSFASGQTCGAVLRSLISTILAEEGVLGVSNLCSANQSSIETDTSGFGSSTGTALTRDTTQHQFGAASLRVVTDGTATFQFVNAQILSGVYTIGDTYTASFYAKGASAGGTLRYFVDSNSGAVSAVNTLTLSTTWTRYSVTFTAASGKTWMGLRLDTGSPAQALTFYWDGLQVEYGGSATAWTLGIGQEAIADGPTLPDVIFNYATVAACADAVAQKAGNYWWQIDANKRLWFQPYAAIAAPWALTADGNNVVTDARNGTVKVKRQKPMYRNRQLIRIPSVNTNTQTETRKGDGNTKAFTFGYPFAKVPTVTVNAVSKTVGIKGVDSGKDWYWNAGDATLTQDSAGTTLISTDTLQVVYVGQFPVIIISEDTAQITAQQTLEGGGTSGKVEDMTEDTSLSTQDAAFAEAASLLAKYTQKAVTLQFQTQRAGLAPGQLLSVTIPQHGFSAASFLIQSIHISDEDGQVIWYDVTAIQGPVNQTWVQFFGQLVTNANAGSGSLSVGASSTLVIVASFTGSIAPTATYTATVQACPICNTSTLCGTGVIIC